MTLWLGHQTELLATFVEEREKQRYHTEISTHLVAIAATALTVFSLLECEVKQSSVEQTKEKKGFTHNHNDTIITQAVWKMTKAEASITNAHQTQNKESQNTLRLKSVVFLHRCKRLLGVKCEYTNAESHHFGIICLFPL